MRGTFQPLDHRIKPATHVGRSTESTKRRRPPSQGSLRNGRQKARLFRASGRSTLLRARCHDLWLIFEATPRPACVCWVSRACLRVNGAPKPTQQLQKCGGTHGPHLPSICGPPSIHCAPRSSHPSSCVSSLARLSTKLLLFTIQ